MKTESNKILILYAEVTPYLLGCLKNFTNLYSDIKLEVIYNKIFSNIDVGSNNFTLTPKNLFKSRVEILSHTIKLDPDLILISGRMDHDYLFIAKKFRKKINIVTVQDSMYQFSIKQLLKTFFSQYLYHQYFNKFWGIGLSQTRFAKSIGFQEKNIKDGFYVADKKFFENRIIINYQNNKNYNFLFIGRLVKEKNILTVAKVLDKINYQFNSQHSLSVIGKGSLLSSLLKHKCVKYFGFKTQQEIIDIAQKSHAFILPSLYEPWGVVVHEMAAIGLPLLVSSLCGSSQDLVVDDFNGFRFNPKRPKEIFNTIVKFINLDDNIKTNFSVNSSKISKKINNNNWNTTILSFLNKT